jgi:hypothetical protein
MQTYNLFRRKGRLGLVCAVPEERSVPAFVSGECWIFTGKIDSPADTPLGFDDRAAAAGVRFNGFYLFADYGVQRFG